MAVAASLPRASRAIAAAVRTGRSGSPAELAARLLASTMEVLPTAGGALVLMDPETLLFSTGAVTDLPVACCHPFFASELDEAAGRTFRRLARSGASASSISGQAAGEDPFGRTVLQPFGYGSELRVVCRDAGAAWGGISLWRRTGEDPFGRHEERELDVIAPLIGRALRDAVLRSLADTAPGQGVRGVMVLEGVQVVEASPQVRELLREIDEPDTVAYRPLDHLLAVAQRDARFSAVIGVRDGQWVVAHGTPLSAGRTAVVLTSAGPAELFGSLVAGCGLSEREIEVTRQLCRGLTDAEIARELTISPHTAHDHVRSVRRKLGVRNRAEVASRIFASHYLDRFLTSAAISH